MMVDWDSPNWGGNVHEALEIDGEPAEDQD